MIHELAEFEHAADQCTVTETQIRTALFGERADGYAHVAEVDGEIAAMALWFLQLLHLGRRRRHLPGRPVRAARRFAAAAWPARCWRRWRANASSNGYTRLSWAVLNWNVDAIALYDGVGGEPQTRVDHLPGVRPGDVGRGWRSRRLIAA